MRMLPLLFVALPLLEIAGFVLVGGWLGLWPVLGLVVLAAVVGRQLIRRQGVRALRQLHRSGTVDPLAPLARAAALVLAGVLLIIPGFVSDLLALALLVPASRRWILRAILARAMVMGPRRPMADGDIIDGDAVEITPAAGVRPRQADRRSVAPPPDRPSAPPPW